MSLLLTMLAVAATPSADMPIFNPRADQPTNCPATSRYEAARRGRALSLRKLGELPDADAYRAVYRHVGKCEAPIIVKYRVGR